MHPFLLTILQLRLLIGFLGKRSQFGWWPTSFFGDYSIQSLEFVAPKTAALAQYHGAVEAARRLHDEHLSVGSYHLFRLPEEVGQDPHALAQSDQGAAIFRGLPRDKETALSSLASMADAAVAAAEGPISLGSISALSEAGSIAVDPKQFLPPLLTDLRRDVEDPLGIDDDVAIAEGGAKRRLEDIAPRDRRSIKPVILRQ